MGKWRLPRWGAGILVVVIFLWVGISLGKSQVPQLRTEFTPVVVTPTLPKASAVLGVDRRYHVLYELVLANTRQKPAWLQEIQVVTPLSKRPVAIYAGESLQKRLRSLDNRIAPSGELGFNETRIFLVDFTLDPVLPLPTRLRHRLIFADGSSPELGGVDLEPSTLTLGPPVRGRGWVAMNGCCDPDVGHRSTGLPINGQIHFAQRFAIDWMQLDERGRLAHGDLTQAKNYTGYGAELIAVADGMVVATRNDLPEQIPPQSPDPKTVNLENVLGNYVILQLAGGQYVLYAHCQPGTVKVQPGMRVRRGQPLGLLGNTGNSSAPHLHLHVMDGATLGSEGVPYQIDQFAVAGRVPAESAEQFYELKGEWRSVLNPQPTPVRNQFPLFLDVVNFAGAS